MDKNFKIWKQGILRFADEETVNNIIEALGGEDAITKATYSNTAESGSAFAGSFLKNVISLTSLAKKFATDASIFPEYVNADSVVKVCLLSQIAKVLLYQENDSTYEINRGKVYKFNDELKGALRVGERSVLIAMNAGVKFTEDEFEAMKILDKDNQDDNYVRYFCSPISTIIKFASEIIAVKNKLKFNANKAEK